MNIAFVLGNGKSRLKVDLTTLKQYGTIYGCNALYRDFTPDVLVATDPEISDEIQWSGYAMDNVFYTRKPIDDFGSQPIIRYFGYSSGPVALSLACAAAHQMIFMLGFDLQGLDGKFNNVYADTKFYKTSQQGETYYGNWIKQICEIAKDFPYQKIIHVADQNTFKPQEWHGLIKSIDLASFLKAVNNKKLDHI